MTTRRDETRRDETRRRTRVGVGQGADAVKRTSLPQLLSATSNGCCFDETQVEENIKVGQTFVSGVPSSKRPTSRSISLEPATTNQTDESSPL